VTIPSRRRTRRTLTVITSLTMIAAGCLVALVALAPPSQAAISWTNCSGGYVGLTYDDGPMAGNTQNLLNTLAQSSIRATVFNIGQNAQNNPALVTAEKNATMWIGNHSFTHPHLTTMTQAQMLSELQRTQTVLQQITGTAPRLFRPPFGETNATLKAVEQQLGLTEIIWDVDSQDWNGASTAQIVAAAGRLQNGQIILMHDFPANTIPAIPQIAQNLLSRNMCPGMISPTTGRAVAPDGTPTTPPVTTTTTTRPPTTTTSTTRPPTTTTNPPPGGACSATSTLISQWNTGFQIEVAVRAGNAAINGWTVRLTFANGQTVTQVWNGVVTGTTSPVSVRNESYNGSVAANASTTFGLIANWSGTNSPPALTCTSP